MKSGGCSALARGFPCRCADDLLDHVFEGGGLLLHRRHGGLGLGLGFSLERPLLPHSSGGVRRLLSLSDLLDKFFVDHNLSSETFSAGGELLAGIDQLLSHGGALD